MIEGKRPLVSIITACFNSEKYIEETIESVLIQDYPEIEYLLIDGASTDNTVMLIKQYEPRFNGRMLWLSEKDKGIYDAFNKGINMASGDLIHLLNSDDYFSGSNIITSVVDAVGCYDVVHGKMRFVNADGKTIKVYGNKNTRLQKYISAPFNHPTMFVRREVYGQIGLFNASYKTAGDYDLMLRIIKQDYRIIYLDQVLINFRTVGVTSAAEELVNPGEIREILINHGLDKVFADLFVWIRVARLRMYLFLKRFPLIINLIRAVLPYHSKEKVN